MSEVRAPALPVPPSRRLRRRLGSRRARLVIGIAAAVCFVVAATVLAASLAGVRLPGESATGSVSLSSAQQEQETLDRAAILGSEGQVADAVQLYNQVLQTDPNQPDALTYGGWLVRLAGLSSKNRLVLARGDASVARAVKVAPGYPDGHALLGVILYEDFAQTGGRLGSVPRRARRGGLEEPADVGRRGRGESLRSRQGALATPLQRSHEERCSRLTVLQAEPARRCPRWPRSRAGGQDLLVHQGEQLDRLRLQCRTSSLF